MGSTTLVFRASGGWMRAAWLVCVLLGCATSPRAVGQEGASTPPPAPLGSEDSSEPEPKADTRRPPPPRPGHLCATSRDLAAWRADPDVWEQVMVERSRLSASTAKSLASGPATKPEAVVIPVVVHVLHTNAAERLPEDLIRKQVERLTADFNLSPERWDEIRDEALDSELPLVAAPRFVFRLAQRTPACEPTNGILYKEVTAADFVLPDQWVAMTNNSPAWDPQRYLNVWIARVAPPRRSYATMPGFEWPAGVPLTPRGVAVNTTFIGPRDPLLTGGEDLRYAGRSLTHEVGHLFGLDHLWNPEFNCVEDSDGLADTPLQNTYYTHDCKSRLNLQTCPLSGGQDMCINFMDYTHDSQRVMFTRDQSERMRLVLAEDVDLSGLTGSDASLPPQSGADAWMRDTLDDTGDEPGTHDGPLYKSPDIWLRRQDDGQQHKAHQAVHADGSTVWVYVRVRNRGCATTTPARLSLHWAFSGTGLAWPAPWDGSVVTPVPLGGLIGEVVVEPLGSGESRTLALPWTPPAGADFAALGGAPHLCLLARLLQDDLPQLGMAVAEGPSLRDNVRNNNNIAWRNVSVLHPAADPPVATFLMANMEVEPACFRLRVMEDPPADGRSLLLDGGAWLDVAAAAAGVPWQPVPGQNVFDISVQPDGWLRLLNTKAALTNVCLAPGQVLPITLRLQSPPGPWPLPRTLRLEQWRDVPGGDVFVGGVEFSLPKR